MTEPKFSKNLKIGFNNRGMGRGDYGIITEDGALIAELKDVHYPSDNPPFQLLPVVENAHLFAAAPELYDACTEALVELKKTGGTELVAKIEAALKKALPPKPSRKRR